ncbi:MAG: hypothetical protein IPL53_16400 [Ignavibacteria bacterium]|nr:hypothetical protein [Ignavibacteria bacterium]
MKSKLLIFLLPVFLFSIFFLGSAINDYPGNIDRSSAQTNSRSNSDILSVSQPLQIDAACTYSWSAQTSGTANQFFSVSAASDQVGWAAGVTATVRKTVNGGAAWTDGNSTPGIITGDIYNVNALDASTAFVTTSPGATFIYRTINGGVTWTQVFTQAGGFIDAIQMISATEGYAMGDPVGGKWTILKTIDGGVTWARMATEPVQVGAEAGWNNSFLIIGTHIWFGTNTTRVYHSTDLGLTWSSGATTGTLNTYALHFNSTTEGLAGGSAAATPLVKTIDGGSTYSQTATYPGTTGNLDGLEGNGIDWWAIRSGTTVYRSQDQGATWPAGLQYVQAGAVFQDIDLTGSGCVSGWAVGNAGVIARMSASSTPSNLILTINFEACSSTDAISVELRSSASPYSIIETASGTGGLGTSQNIAFSNASDATPYYIVVRHRNSIETWSSVTAGFTAGALSYNFTTSASQAYGNNEVLVGSNYSLYTGDVNQNGIVDLTDLIAVFNDATSFVSGYVATDLNCDNLVTLTDVLYDYNNVSLFVERKRP